MTKVFNIPVKSNGFSGLVTLKFYESGTESIAVTNKK